MLLSVEQASKVIDSGRVVSVAGDEALLRRLPSGAWLGGTIPYFMGQSGGETTRDKLFVKALPCDTRDVSIKTYGVDELPRIIGDAPDNGFSIVVLPATSDVHIAYARNAPYYDGMFLKPIIGWVSGVHLDDLGTVTPKVFDGLHGAATDARAVVLHAQLPANKIANMGIVNLFTPGNADKIRFPETGFSAEDCLINGKQRNLAEYLTERRIDTRLPLVADYCGAMVNVSFQSVDPASGQVSFYAPVFNDIEYHIANPVADYVGDFQGALPDFSGDVTFSCNCILNFMYSELEGRKTGKITGPMTFGEVAYQLLNQTMVYMTVEDNA